MDFKIKEGNSRHMMDMKIIRMNKITYFSFIRETILFVKAETNF